MKNHKEYYQFTLKLENVDIITDTMEDSLFEAGCDDALLYSSNNNVFLDFNREELNLAKALNSAINHIELAGYKCKIWE